MLNTSSNQNDCNYWHKVIAAHGQSGQSQKNFCQQNGINYNQFSYRKNQLSKQLQVKSSNIAPVVVKNPPDDAEHKSSEIGATNLILETKEGLKLNIPPNVNKGSLRLVLSLLGGLGA